MEAVEKLIKAIGAARAAMEVLPESQHMKEAIRQLMDELDCAKIQAIEDATQDAG